MNYYYLIAGLPDIEIEDNKLTFSIADFREMVRPQLSANDARLMDLFFMKFDNQNLLHYLKDKETQFDEHGSITKGDMEEIFRLIGEGNKSKFKQFLSNIFPKNQSFPSYFKTFLLEYRKDAEQAEKPDTDESTWENRLTELYYNWAMKCGNKLISDWFEFNLNLNNILAAYNSRKYKMNVEALGDNAVSQAVKTSKQRDFGLTEILEDIDIFQRLADEPDLFEREKKIDQLKWKWLDEHTFFKYFSIEILFAYLVKLEIIERWVSLDPVEGEKLFRSLIDNLKESVVNSPESVNLRMNDL
jgi:hypothetical protein